MFDAEIATSYSANARRHTLWPSLEHVFWRAPRWYELLICLWLPFGFWLDHGFSVSVLPTVLARLAALVLIVRSFDVPMHFCENRWPDGGRGVDYGARGVVGLAIFYFALPVLLKMWRDGTRNSTDWAATQSNAVAYVAFGVFMIVLLGPLMWSLDRVFKPLCRSKSQKFGGALIFLALCGAWWMIVITGSIVSGLAQLIWGHSP